MQVIVCLLFGYFLYSTVTTSREIAALKERTAHAKCVKELLTGANEFVTELSGDRRTLYDAYADELGRAGEGIKNQPELLATRLPTAVVTEVGRHVVQRSEEIQAALRITGTKEVQSGYSLDDLTALVRPLVPFTEEERDLIATYVQPDASRFPQLAMNGKVREFRNLLPAEVAFAHYSCPDEEIDSRGGSPGAWSRAGDVERRLVALAEMRRQFGGREKITEKGVGDHEAKLREDREKKAGEADLAKVELPVIGQGIEVSLAFRLGPVALFLLALLISVFHRHRCALVEGLIATLDVTDVVDRRIREGPHLFLLPWVLNFPYLRAERFRQERPPGGLASRGALRALEFLPVLAILAILARPITFGTQGTIDRPTVSTIDWGFFGLSVVLLVLTFQQMLYTRTLERRTSEALGWIAAVPTVPVPAVAAPAPWPKVRYAVLVLSGLLTNWAYALTPTLRIDLSIVPPVLAVVAGYRFGKIKAAILGLVVAGAWLPAALNTVVSPGDLLYRRFWIGPFYIPHSSSSDVVGLALLGYLAGWLFERSALLVPRFARALAGAWPAFRPAVTRARGVARFIAAVVLILLANVVVGRFANLGGERRQLVFLPLGSLAIVACFLAGSWLGARRGRLAGAGAGVISFLVHPFIATGPQGIQLEFHDVGHVVSFALLAYWSGRLAEFLSDGRPEPVDGKRPTSSWSPWVPLVLVWMRPCLLVLAFVISLAALHVTLGGILSLNLLFLPLAEAAVMLMGAWWGPRPAAWTTGTTMAAIAFLAPAAQILGWIVSIPIGGLSLTLMPARWSAAAVVVFTLAAFVAGTIDLRESRATRLWLAIGMFAVLEIVTLLRFGVFPAPNLTGQVYGLRVDLATNLARLLEPWLTVILVEAGLRRLAVAQQPRA